MARTGPPRRPLVFGDGYGFRDGPPAVAMSGLLVAWSGHGPDEATGFKFTRKLSRPSRSYLVPGSTETRDGPGPGVA